MPSKKQRRRTAKERRHEYETVWVDSEGNELEEPPEQAAVATRERRDDTKRKPKAQQQRDGRPTRVPPEPSWPRAIKRSLIWVVVLGVLLVWVQSRSAHADYIALIPVAAAYVFLFPVMTYYIDRSMYRRYLKKQQDGPKKR